jgi:hypothetical protein
VSLGRQHSAVTALAGAAFWGAGICYLHTTCGMNLMYWNVLLSCSPEAGTGRRKPGQKMSVWPPSRVRGAILTLAAILIFIYLVRS